LQKLESLLKSRSSRKARDVDKNRISACLCPAGKSTYIVASTFIAKYPTILPVGNISRISTNVCIEVSHSGFTIYESKKRLFINGLKKTICLQYFQYIRLVQLLART